MVCHCFLKKINNRKNTPSTYPDATSIPQAKQLWAPMLSVCLHGRWLHLNVMFTTLYSVVHDTLLGFNVMFTWHMAGLNMRLMLTVDMEVENA